MIMWHIFRSQSVSEKRVMAETCFKRDPKQTGKESCLLTFPGFLSYRVHSHSPVGRMMPHTVNWAFLGQLRWWRLFPTVVSTGKSNLSNPSIELSFSFDSRLCQSNSWPKLRRTATQWMSGHPDSSAKNLALMWEKKGDGFRTCYWRSHSALKKNDENNNLRKNILREVLVNVISSRRMNFAVEIL